MAKTEYTPEQREEALKVYVTDGPAAAERTTGISRHTISSWAGRSGLSTDAPTKERTEAARAKRLYDHEQFKTRMQGLLAEIAELGAYEEIRQLAAGEAPLQQVVGARTRAIHDLMLMGGEGTSRTEVTTPEQLAAYLLDAREAFDQQKAEQ